MKKKKFKNGIAKLGRQEYEVLVTRRDSRAGGQRISRRRVVNGSRYEAEAVKRELEAELEAELSGKAKPKLTLGDYARQWLEARSAALRPTTRRKYVIDLEKHILPALGHMLLSELRPRHLAAYFAKDPAAPKSKKTRLSLLRTMAKDALADELVDRDFCLRIQVKVPPPYTEDEPNMLSARQLPAVLACVPARWSDLAYLLAFTGLRWGEATGLHWSEVDLEKGEATIKWNNSRGTLGRPKTDEGYRTIPLATPLLERLRARKERMEADGHPPLRRGLVFSQRNGNPYQNTTFPGALREACKKAGVTFRFTPHGFRRTWNNMARRVAGGVVVRAMMGQASEAMTDHYSLVDRDERRATAELVAARFLAAKNDEPEQNSGERTASPEAGNESPDAAGTRPVDETVDRTTTPQSSTDPKEE